MIRRQLVALALALSLGACGANSPDATKSSKALGISLATTTLPTTNLSVTSSVKGAKTIFVVRMLEDPVLGYDGSDPAYAATKPAKGKRFDPRSSASKKYVAHLVAEHDKVLGAAGASGDKLYSYVYSFNGFSALLTQAQAQQIASMPGVLSVAQDERRNLTTETSPKFLGISESGGLWAAAGGPEKAGEGVIIGVIDTGIWPEHPSFSDQEDLGVATGQSGKRTVVYDPPPAHWNGTCQAGERWSKDDCNNKLIGARYYLLGAGHQGILPSEFLSARDADGHGTHTSSTAGGNYGVESSVFGNSLGPVSGMAPRARIAMYKACWTFKDGGAGCYGSDLVAAIDDAVADGVDVINYSIGGGSTALNTADAISFLLAEDAGVFIATSAGNSGPGASTIGNPAVVPWVTTVGASTHTRDLAGTATLGNGDSYTGASITAGTAALPLVDSADAGSELCYVGELNPAVVAGKIVLCRRGVTARVDKSLAVAIAGGAGLILYNPDLGMTTSADLHYLPAVHVDVVEGAAIKAYIASAGSGATAQLSGGGPVPGQGKVMAGFSSRGPNGGTHDVIKPDVTAPGVNILAGYSPEPVSGVQGQAFTPMSGTSMSSPHVAGIGAMLKYLHPDWSPAMIKSALMTTATQDAFKEDGVTPADPFDAGSGHIAPNSAADPGLVFPAGFYDYLAFLCGTTNAVSPKNCAALASMGYSHDPSELNLASIAIGALAGVETVTRKVVNVGQTAATYVVTTQAPAGLQVDVSPASLTLAPEEEGTFTVTFTRTTATLGEFAFGALIWSDGAHNVRVPFAVKPVQIAAPFEVGGAGTSGSVSYDVTFGYTGFFEAKPWGLTPALTVADTVVDDPANDINTALATGVGVNMYLLYLPAGAKHMRFSLFDEDTDGADDDLDLYAWGPYDFATENWPELGSSGSPTSNEEINVADPAGGYYLVAVHGWQTEGPDAQFTLFAWGLYPDSEGNMTVSAPSSATLAGTGSVQATWSDLATGQRYLGAVGYYDGADPFGKTLVSVSTK